MAISDISVQGVQVNMLGTGEMMEAMDALKTELKERAQRELADLDQLRNKLIEILGKTPAPCDSENEENPLQSRSKRLPPKYWNPDNPDQTWSGRGKRPAWVMDYLNTNPDGTLDDLLIPDELS